ncbi:MAG: polysaccharide biosynthesis tyrosine autokinase [Rikenellaceae bacterium]
MNNDLTLRDIWEFFLANIFLFFASIVIALLCAVAYIAVTPPTYRSGAAIVIKDDSRNQMGGQASTRLEDMGLFKSVSNISNEIHLIKTPRLMVDVVKRLGLDYDYKVKYRDVRWVPLYRTTPFRVVLDSVIQSKYIDFDLRFRDNNMWEISSLTIGDEEFDKSISGAFGEPVSHPALAGMTIFNVSNGKAEKEDNLYHFTKSHPMAAAGRFAGAVSVGLRDEMASIVDMTIVDGSAQRAADILNTLIEVYKENWIKDRNTVTISTSSFINERLAVIEQELGIVDSDISAYKSSNLLPDINAVTGINLQKTNQNMSKQLELSNQLSMAKYIQKLLSDKSQTSQLLPVNTGVGGGSIEGQISRYNELVLEKSALLVNSTEENPVIADMNNRLSNIRSVIELSINDLVSTLELQISNAQKEERDNAKRIAGGPEQERYLLTAGRQQKVKEALYLFLLQKREENELTQTFTAYNTVTLSQAGGGVPIAPQRNVIILMALCIGVALPVVYLVLRENLDTVIRSKEDLKELDLPFIGSIPLIERRKSLFEKIRESLKRRFGAKLSRHKVERPKVIVSDKSRNVINEAFRIVRTNLDFMTVGENRSRVFIITSINPGSGKSFIAANLSLSMAIKSCKVLVIDTDMRRATLSGYVGSPKVGLANYLSGMISDIDSAIVKDSLHANLDLLPVGVIPPNPSELLLSDKFGELIAQLRGRYDYIFMDGTPVEIVPDASIVEKHCDSTIFVVRAGLMDSRLIPELKELYTSKQFRSMSILLNCVNGRRRGYYGYGKYGYGYGKYGYGKYGSYGSYGSYGGYGYYGDDVAQDDKGNS